MSLWIAKLVIQQDMGAIPKRAFHLTCSACNSTEGQIDPLDFYGQRGGQACSKCHAYALFSLENEDGSYTIDLEIEGNRQPARMGFPTRPPNSLFEEAP